MDWWFSVYNVLDQRCFAVRSPVLVGTRQWSITPLLLMALPVLYVGSDLRKIFELHCRWEPYPYLCLEDLSLLQDNWRSHLQDEWWNLKDALSNFIICLVDNTYRCRCSPLTQICGTIWQKILYLRGLAYLLVGVGAPEDMTIVSFMLLATGFGWLKDKIRGL